MLKEGVFGCGDPRPHDQHGCRHDLEINKYMYNLKTIIFYNLAICVPTKIATRIIFLAISGILKRNKSGMKVHKRYGRSWKSCDKNLYNLQ